MKERVAASRRAATIAVRPRVVTGGLPAAPRPRRAAGALASAGPSKTIDDVPADLLRALQLVGAELAAPLPLDRIAAAVAQSGIKSLDAEVLLIALCEGADRRLRVVHDSGLEPTARPRLPAVLAAASRLLGRREQSQHAPFDLVAAALLGIRLPDDGSSPSVSQAVWALIPPPERPLGIIVVGRRHGRAFSDEERGFLNVLAALSALALERLRLSTGHYHHDRMLRPQQLGLPLSSAHLRMGDMEIDLENQDVAFGGRRIRLTPTELRLVLFLATEPGRVRTRREILRHLWHTDHVGDERACDAHISNLRRKIERDPARPERVVTLRGVGYALRMHRNGA